MQPELSKVVNTQPPGQQPEEINLLRINETWCAVSLHDDIRRMQISMIHTTGMQEGHVTAQPFNFFKRITGYWLTYYPSSQQKELSRDYTAFFPSAERFSCSYTTDSQSVKMSPLGPAPTGKKKMAQAIFGPDRSATFKEELSFGSFQIEDLTHDSVLDLITTGEFTKETVKREIRGQRTRRDPKPTEFSP
jgi:hypothetical protein